jgi:hypothetical protein
MVRVLELALGVALLVPSVLAMAYPHADFALGKRLMIGVDNREELELNQAGLLRNYIGYGLMALVALGLILDSVGLL